MNVLICGGVFYGQTKAEPKRTDHRRGPVGKHHGGTVTPARSPGGAADPGWGAAGDIGAVLRVGVRRYCGARIGVRALWKEKGRVCVYPAVRGRFCADPPSGWGMPSDGWLGSRLRFEDAVRYDGDDDDYVFHKNEQK